MNKSAKIVLGFCFLFFLTSLISFSQQNKILKNPIPVPPDQGMIICDDPLIDQSPPISPAWNSRHSRKYKAMVAGDYDGDGYDELAFEFGSQGIWIYDPNAATAWNRISYKDPKWMIAITISSTSDDELFVEWASGSSPQDSWWQYSGYPGTWIGISDSLIDYAYDAGDVNGDGDHEVVVQWDGAGIFVCNFTGSGDFGGFDLYNISSIEAHGFPVQFAAADYELLHAFSDGTKYWNYTSGYPDTNWTSINSAVIGWTDSIAADIDGGTTITDELMADIIYELWLYDYDYGSWTRLNYNHVCEMYPVAYDNLNKSYEFLVHFCSLGSLWCFNPDLSKGGVRVSWNIPDYVLGANFRTAANGGNNGEEAIADFGSMGVWIQLVQEGSWTRINWNDPQSMIQANLDADPEMEIIFDFGNLGVWVWNGATGKGTWTRITWGNPEYNASIDGYDECEGK